MGSICLQNLIINLSLTCSRINYDYKTFCRLNSRDSKYPDSCCTNDHGDCIHMSSDFMMNIFEEWKMQMWNRAVLSSPVCLHQICKQLSHVRFTCKVEIQDGVHDLNWNIFLLFYRRLQVIKCQTSWPLSFFWPFESTHPPIDFWPLMISL